MSPVQRTLKHLRSQGWEVGVVERFIYRPNGPGHRSDLFGIIDLIAITAGQLMGVQACGTDHSSHVKKMADEMEDQTRMWLASGSRLQLISWRQLAAYKKDGTRAKRDRWEPRIVEFTLGAPGDRLLHSELDLTVETQDSIDEPW